MHRKVAEEPLTLEVSSFRIRKCYGAPRNVILALVVNTTFHSLWFDPIGNETRVYRFSRKRSTNLSTDIGYLCE